MSKKVFIRGSKEHPERVIEALGRLGGKFCATNVKGDNPDSIYRIADGGCIVEIPDCWITEVITSHPDWKEIFPDPDYKFKVGDIVTWCGNCGWKITELMNVDGEPHYMLGDSVEAAEDELTAYQLKILSWDDMESQRLRVEGYWIHPDAYIAKYTNCACSLSRNVYHTKTQALSALAMAQISQLIEQPAYGGWVPLGQEAWTIVPTKRHDGTLRHCVIQTICRSSILRFHTRTQAEQFLLKNRELVNDYLMIQTPDTDETC